MAHAGFELLIILPPPPRYWDLWFPPCPAHFCTIMVQLSGLPRDHLTPSPKVSFPWPLAGRIILPGLSTPMQNAFLWFTGGDSPFSKHFLLREPRGNHKGREGARCGHRQVSSPSPPHSSLGPFCLQLLRTLVALSMSALPSSVRAVLPAASLGERLWPQAQPCLSLILADAV